MTVRQLAIVVALSSVAPVGAQVSVARLQNAAADPGNWLTYSGSYQSQRFSPLAQVTTDNVARLRPSWIYQPPGAGALETTPVVVDGVMYVTSPPASVIALDLRSGRPLWEWSRPMPADLRTLGFGRVNRGVAILDNTVYVGALDAHLVALDARSGVERWTAKVADNASGHAITAAPLAPAGKIIVSISGGDGG